MTEKRQAWIDRRLLEGNDVGLGEVLVARKKSGGRIEAGLFLIDIWCLGVRDAFFYVIEEDELEDLLSRVFEKGFMLRDASCGRKFVEGAVSYAQRLGFAPHRDYKKAARVFGGIDVKDCPEAFEFGKNGKPFYMQGPYHDAAMAERIMAKLRAVKGDDFDYFLVPPQGDFNEQEDRDEEDLDDVEYAAGKYALRAEQSGGGTLLPEFAAQLKHLGDGMTTQGLDGDIGYDETVFDFADFLAQAIREFADAIRPALSDEEEGAALDSATIIFTTAVATVDMDESELSKVVGDPDTAEMVSSLMRDERVRAVVRSITQMNDGVFNQIIYAGWDDAQERLLVIYAELPSEEE